MKRKLSYAVLAALGAFVLVLLSGVPLPYPVHAQASPSVAVSLSSASVEERTAITVTMSFGGLESDADTSTRDYVFRADVVGADECEDQAGGYGLGVDRYMHKVDEDPETRTGSVSADCPAGDYTVQASISSPDDVELASARASFTVTAPAPEPTPEPTPDQEDPDPSVALALSPVGFAPWNTEISVTMLFGALKADSDRDTTDYVFRADVVDADACEGDGLGVDRYMYEVDEDPETRSGTIAAGCPIGDYTIESTIATEADGVVASTSAEFSIFGPSIGLAIPATEQGAGGVLTPDLRVSGPGRRRRHHRLHLPGRRGGRRRLRGRRPGSEPLHPPGGRGPGDPHGDHIRRLPGGRLHPGSEHIVARRRGAGLDEGELQRGGAGRRGGRPAGFGAAAGRAVRHHPALRQCRCLRHLVGRHHHLGGRLR